MSTMTIDQVANNLADRLSLVQVPEPATADGSFSQAFANEMTVKLKADVLATFAKFLGEFSEFLPEKDTVLAALEKAIDMAFTAAGRPFISNLIKPAVTRLILDAASKLYDVVVEGTEPDVEPRTEV